MITGVVNAHDEVIIRLLIRGPGGQGQAIEAVIDTGFNGFLTVTTALVQGWTSCASVVAERCWRMARKSCLTSTRRPSYGTINGVLWRRMPPRRTRWLAWLCSIGIAYTSQRSREVA